jgi:hypothetical protein
MVWPVQTHPAQSTGPESKRNSGDGGYFSLDFSFYRTALPETAQARPTNRHSAVAALTILSRSRTLIVYVGVETNAPPPRPGAAVRRAAPAPERTGSHPGCAQRPDPDRAFPPAQRLAGAAIALRLSRAASPRVPHVV